MQRDTKHSSNSQRFEARDHGAVGVIDAEKRTRSMTVPGAASVRTAGTLRACAFAAIGLAVMAAIGTFAVRLNARFYATNQPFYDSMAYNARTFRTMRICQESGLLAALRQSGTNDTVVLPDLIASFAALFVEPSRAVGIWIQMGELALLAGSLFYYFTRVRNLSASLAAVAISPFLFLQCLYLYNGGLSDFRMDLSLMLMFSLTATWYLIATATGSRLHYILLGLSCGATCLTRGTAPVYFAAVFGPMAAVDLLFHRPWKPRAKGLALAAAVAAATSLWFFVRNYNYLYYYYAVWNTAANAHLPPRESIGHFRYLEEHIGKAVFWFAVLFQLTLAADALLRQQSIAAAVARLRTMKLNWTALWLGLAPIGLLMLLGAGLNPFVSMPAAFGCLLFALFPFRNSKQQRVSRPAFAALAVSVAVCSATAMTAGWKNHAGPAPDSMGAHKATLRAIVADARQAGKSEARYATTHSFFLNTFSLQNVAMFDIPDAHATSQQITLRGVRLEPSPCFAVAAEADWRVVHGATPEQKLEHMIEHANQQIDYLIIPTPETAAFVQKNISFNVINRYAVELRTRLLTCGQWQEISGDIRNSNDEAVRVYRNVGHADSATAMLSGPAGGGSARRNAH